MLAMQMLVILITIPYLTIAIDIHLYFKKLINNNVEMIFILKQSKITPLCISIETVEVAFFVTGLETLQIKGIKHKGLDRVKCKVI
jgi:hypothetical protein